MVTNMLPDLFDALMIADNLRSNVFEVRSFDGSVVASATIIEMLGSNDGTHPHENKGLVSKKGHYAADMAVFLPEDIIPYGNPSEIHLRLATREYRPVIFRLLVSKQRIEMTMVKQSARLGSDRYHNLVKSKLHQQISYPPSEQDPGLAKEVKLAVGRMEWKDILRRKKLRQIADTYAHKCKVQLEIARRRKDEEEYEEWSQDFASWSEWQAAMKEDTRRMKEKDDYDAWRAWRARMEKEGKIVNGELKW